MLLLSTLVKNSSREYFNIFLNFPIKHDLTFSNPGFLEIVINLLSAQLAQSVIKINVCNLTVSLDVKLSDIDKDYRINPKFWDRHAWINSVDPDQ